MDVDVKNGIENKKDIVIKDIIIDSCKETVMVLTNEMVDNFVAIPSTSLLNVSELKAVTVH